MHNFRRTIGLALLAAALMGCAARVPHQPASPAAHHHLVIIDDNGTPRFFELDGTGRFPTGRVVALSTNPEVTLDGRDDDDFGEWGLAATGAAVAWPKSTGSSVIIAVLDTGVDTTHPEFAGRVLPGIDLVEHRSVRDPNGHGTHVAGIIAAAADGQGTTGLAPSSSLLPVRVLDAAGFGDHADIAAGIVWAVEHDADVINLSLGGEGSEALATAIEFAVRSAVIVVAAAGNNGGLLGNEPSYPAAYPGVISVGASTPDDSVAVFSATGPHLDLLAPGFAIRSTVPGGYGYATGTSQAAPFVSAAAALLLADGTPAKAVPAALTAAARDVAPTGRDDRSGAGVLDAGFALTKTRSVPPVPPGTQPGPDIVTITQPGPIGAISVAPSVAGVSPMTVYILAAGCDTCAWEVRTNLGRTYPVPTPARGAVVQHRVVVHVPPNGELQLYADTTVVASVAVAPRGSAIATEHHRTARTLEVTATTTSRSDTPATLELLRDNAWSTVATSTIRSDGYRFTVSSAPRGFYRVRIGDAVSDPFRT